MSNSETALVRLTEAGLVAQVRRTSDGSFLIVGGQTWETIGSSSVDRIIVDTFGIAEHGAGYAVTFERSPTIIETSSLAAAVELVISDYSTRVKMNQ
jgi:hypothetical protein